MALTPGSEGAGRGGDAGASRRHPVVRRRDGLPAACIGARLEAGVQPPPDHGCAGERQGPRSRRAAVATAGIRAPGIPAAAPAQAAAIAGRAELIVQEAREERRRTSKKAEIVAPRQGFRLPRPIRRLQRQAPTIALRAVGELSTRLRDITGSTVTDLNPLMYTAPHVYHQ